MALAVITKACALVLTTRPPTHHRRSLVTARCPPSPMSVWPLRQCVYAAARDGRHAVFAPPAPLPRLRCTRPALRLCTFRAATDVRCQAKGELQRTGAPFSAVRLNRLRGSMQASGKRRHPRKAVRRPQNSAVHAAAARTGRRIRAAASRFTRAPCRPRPRRSCAHVFPRT